MFKNYLKIAFRNLWKNKGYAMISIGGLSIALSCFILALLYANYEWSFDKAFKDDGQLYRVEMKEDGNLSPHLAAPLANIFQQQAPEIVQKTDVLTSPDDMLLTADEQKGLYAAHIFYSDSNFFQIFNYPFIYGNPRQALSVPNGIVLAQNIAERLFGKTNPLGKKITVDNQVHLTVTGVFDNQAFPSHFNMDVIRPFQKNTGLDLWRANYVYSYLKLAPQTNISRLQNKLTKITRRELAARYKSYHYTDDVYAKLLESVQKKQTVLQPVTAIHLEAKSNDEIAPGGSKTAIWLIIGLASFMLLIAAINFSNLIIARAPSRAKEIGIRKVFGSSRALVLHQFMLESILQCVLALFIALILTELFLPLFSRLLTVPLSLHQYASVSLWLQIGLLLLAVIILAGLYPALHLSLFRPAKILKGNFSRGTSGKTIFQTLTTVQFLITAVFIAGILIMNAQVRYMKHKDLGFSTDQVVVLKISDWNNQKRIPFINHELEKIPGVEAVAKTSMAGIPDSRTTISIKLNGKSFAAQYLCVGTEFFHALRSRIISGRDFLPGDTLKGMIINKTLAEAADIHSIGDVHVSGSNHVVGIVDDLNFYGFENKVGPMAFLAFDFTSTPYLLVKLHTANIEGSLASIKKLWQTIEPGFPLQYQFMDQNFEALYLSYERLGNIFGIFTFLALLIALMGLSALAAFITERRTKEIAVRKILGASLQDVLKLLNKNFVILVLIANLLAFPIAYLLAQNWLNGFAYRISMPVMPFVLAGMLSMVLTILIVSLQVMRAAKANPVNALKYE